MDRFHDASRADFFEAGYGNGAHVRSVRKALEPIGNRRLFAWDQLSRPLPESVKSIDRLTDIAPHSITGLMFSYELFDALPVHRLVQRPNGCLGEMLVGLDDAGAFTWVEGDLSRPGLGALVPAECEDLEIGQLADLSLGWRPLYRDLASRLEKGLLVTCDYGFEAAQLLDSRIRMSGTLACYRSQQVHRNPFVAVGEQDLTAHVDFSALREEGENAGLETVCLTRQARWLTACGLFEELQDAAPATVMEAGTLLSGEGMGEEIRVLVQARDLDPTALFDLEVLG
jgi:SAM-dependent MidA family methyltransferase